MGLGGRRIPDLGTKVSDATPAQRRLPLQPSSGSLRPPHLAALQSLPRFFLSQNRRLEASLGRLPAACKATLVAVNGENVPILPSEATDTFAGLADMAANLNTLIGASSLHSGMASRASVRIDSAHSLRTILPIAGLQQQAIHAKQRVCPLYAEAKATLNTLLSGIGCQPLAQALASPWRDGVVISSHAHAQICVQPAPEQAPLLARSDILSLGWHADAHSELGRLAFYDRAQAHRSKVHFRIVVFSDALEPLLEDDALSGVFGYVELVPDAPFWFSPKVGGAEPWGVLVDDRDPNHPVDLLLWAEHAVGLPEARAESDVPMPDALPLAVAGVQSLPSGGPPLPRTLAVPISSRGARVIVILDLCPLQTDNCLATMRQLAARLVCDSALPPALASIAMPTGEQLAAAMMMIPQDISRALRINELDQQAFFALSDEDKLYTVQVLPTVLRHYQGEVPESQVTFLTKLVRARPSSFHGAPAALARLTNADLSYVARHAGSAFQGAPAALARLTNADLSYIARHGAASAFFGSPDAIMRLSQADRDGVADRAPSVARQHPRAFVPDGQPRARSIDFSALMAGFQ